MIRKIDFTKMIYICLLSFISTYMIETMMCTCIRYWKRWPLSRLIVRVWMLCWDCPSDMFYWCWSCRRLVLNSMTKVSPWIYDVDTWKNTRKLQGRLRPVNVQMHTYVTTWTPTRGIYTNTSCLNDIHFTYS